MTLRRSAAAFVAVMAVFGLSEAAVSTQASSENEADRNVELRQIQGEVGLAGKNYLTLVYDKGDAGEEYEMGFRINDEVAFRQVDSLSQLQPGDSVKVVYEHVTEFYDYELEDGTIEKREKIVARNAKQIIFMRRSRTLTSHEADR